jgi:hypothetical protein
MTDLQAVFGNCSPALACAQSREGFPCHLSSFRYIDIPESIYEETTVGALGKGAFLYRSAHSFLRAQRGFIKGPSQEQVDDSMLRVLR